MAFRFIHTADWQIGKPFAHVAGDPGAELRSQRIRTVQRIAELAAEAQVDAVLVAGDAFDSNEVADRTIFRTVEALKPFGGTWVFLPGNHDAALAHSVWTRARAMGLPDNIVIADRPEPVDRWNGRATVLPAPLRRRREVMDQTDWFDEAPSPEGSCRVGLAHGSVAGRLPDRGDSSNEIRDDRAERARLCYLALGDWHGALRIAPRTWYAGAPEPDRHKANDSGHVHLVTLDGPGAPERVEMRAVGHFAWVRLEVELLGTCDKAIQALEALGRDPRACVVSLVLKGSVSLSERDRLERALALWEARLHHLDADLGGLVDDPSADDLDALDTAGFVRLAVERLRARAQDPADPEAAAARMALRMIYLDHLRGAEG
ncbi:metallophosphoesterase family protein [Rubellimicrobium roseum]|uniref:DNA repair exonuclease n=1 Tax=Rubellimicrobium roseum TaxID=687525 RepID=A0A5C4NBN9_9RHOB|nr:DNA repair exonuclease [Rubellimicrobium roseum]TNC72194.1 DNA repair exonuclease [Rubellimicrobium roseum]